MGQYFDTTQDAALVADSESADSGRIIKKNPQTPSPYGIYFIYRDRHQTVCLELAAAGVCRYDGKDI